LASIAIPIESINHAIEARVNTVAVDLIITNIITTYIARDNEATTHESL
jgi:hypothetical protein